MVPNSTNNRNRRHATSAPAWSSAETVEKLASAGSRRMLPAFESVPSALAMTSRDDLLYDLAVNVGETELAALEFEGQALVIDAQQVQ